MKIRAMLVLATLAAAMTGAVFASPRPGASGRNSAGSNSSSASAGESDWRLEGEQRFRANCGRCHLAPHKFSPRMMATILRHMRVRATLTDADMRLILRYMTQ